MREIEVLHTAARRYLMAQVAKWREAAWAPGQSESDRLTFHGYLDVAEAILAAVEGFVPGDFASLEEARALLALAGRSMPRYVYRPEPLGSVVREAQAAEQERFLRFLAQTDPVAIVVEPLPFRRVLSRAEVKRLQASLNSVWGAGASDWFPPVEEPKGAVAEIEASGYHEAVSDEALLAILREHGVGRVYELLEWGAAYELDLELMEPYYFPQRHFFDASLSWVFFASHEGTIGLGGEWLIERVRTLHPDWELPSWRRPRA